MTFNEKIVKLRKLKGLTQDEFASAVGVSRQAVYKWESGQSYPEVAKLLEIKLLFNISIDDLLDENYEVVVPEKKKRKRLSKEVKKEIEEKVETEAEATAEAPATEEKEEVAVAAAVETEVVEEPTSEAVEAKEEAPAAEVEAAEDAIPEKKRGFFGRLFGRK